MMEEKYRPLARNWCALALFDSLDKNKIKIDTQFKNNYRKFLICDLQAESDATNLYKKLTENKFYSQEFFSFITVWYRDELNHAAGFRKILHLLYGDDEEDLVRLMSKRKANFEELEHFLDDEFKLCVLFAYDECASTMTYKKDNFYHTLGLSEFSEWIKRLVRDEARHFINAVKLIHHKHSHRLSEVQNVINEILAFENSGASYKATFLFDHDGEHFLLNSDELNNECAKKVYNMITRKNY